MSSWLLMISILAVTPAFDRYFKTVTTALSRWAPVSHNIASLDENFRRKASQKCCVYLDNIKSGHYKWREVLTNCTICSRHRVLSIGNCIDEHVFINRLLVFDNGLTSEFSFLGARRRYQRTCCLGVHLQDVGIYNTTNKFSLVGIVRLRAKRCLRSSYIRKLTRRSEILRSLRKLCNKICGLVNQNTSRQTNVEPRQLDMLTNRGLARNRRHILDNKSSTYFEYFSPSHATSLIPTMHIISQSAHRRASSVTTRSNNIMPTPWYCPETVVVNKSTIYLKRADYFQRTLLIATDQLTPVPEVTYHTVPINLSGTISGFTHSNIISSTKPTPSSINTAMINSTDRKMDAFTFIHNSSLVSVIRTAANSSYVYVTTLDCLPLTRETTPSSLAFLGPASSTTVQVTQGGGTRDVRMLISFAVAGGVILAFLIMVVLFFSIRRYRRSQSLRRKKKQISYFNRYDRSSVWDEEPFGGSRLSVFTLKNSKFDIDWEPNDGRKQEGKNEDFEGR